MRLYLVTRTDGVGYDEYDSFVIAAKNVNELRKLIKEDQPRDGGWPYGLFADFTEGKYETSCIGTAGRGILDQEVIISSFNAG